MQINKQVQNIGGFVALMAGPLAARPLFAAVPKVTAYYDPATGKLYATGEQDWVEIGGGGGTTDVTTNGYFAMKREGLFVNDQVLQEMPDQSDPGQIRIGSNDERARCREINLITNFNNDGAKTSSIGLTRDKLLLTLPYGLTLPQENKEYLQVKTDRDIEDIFLRTFLSSLGLKIHARPGFDASIVIGDTEGTGQGTSLQIQDLGNEIKTVMQNAGYGIRVSYADGQTSIGDFDGNVNGTLINVDDGAQGIRFNTSTGNYTFYNLPNYASESNAIGAGLGSGRVYRATNPDANGNYPLCVVR